MVEERDLVKEVAIQVLEGDVELITWVLLKLILHLGVERIDLTLQLVNIVDGAFLLREDGRLVPIFEDL